MTHKYKVTKKTKTIYYAYIQTIEVPVEFSEKEIDDAVFETVMPSTDFMWSEEPDLFELEKYY